MSSEPRTLTRKLLDAHLVGGTLVPGEEIELARRPDPDRGRHRDACAASSSRRSSVDRCVVPLAVMYVDHNVLQLDTRDMEAHRYLQVVLRPGSACSTRGRATGSRTTCTWSASRGRARCSSAPTRTRPRRARSAASRSARAGSRSRSRWPATRSRPACPRGRGRRARRRALRLGAGEGRDPRAAAALRRARRRRARSSSSTATASRRCPRPSGRRSAT